MDGKCLCAMIEPRRGLAASGANVYIRMHALGNPVARYPGTTVIRVHHGLHIPTPATYQQTYSLTISHFNLCFSYPVALFLVLCHNASTDS